MNLEECARKVYVFDPRTEQFRHPAVHEIQWHVLLLLGTHSRKFIFCGRQLPDQKLVNEAILDLVVKVKKTICEDEKDPLPWYYDKKAPKSRPEYRGSMVSAKYQQVVPLCDELARKLKIQSREVIAKIQRKGGWTNFLPCFKAALRDLKHESSEWVAELTDKDGGWCLIQRDWLRRLIGAKLKSHIYEEITPPNLESWKRAYVHHARELGKGFDDESMRKYLVGKVNGSDASRGIQQIMTTIKTHKEFPEVRLIHSSVGHPSSSLSTAVSRLLQTKVDEFSHVHKNTESVLKHLQNARVGRRFAMYKADIKDFYLQADHGRLREIVNESFLEHNARSAIVDAVSVLLEGQFVTSKLFPGRTYKVRTGTGMGCRHSGALADLHYAMGAEPKLLTDEARNKYFLEAYLRYRDDILVIHTTNIVDPSDEYAFGRRVMEFRKLMKNEALREGYRLELDEIVTDEPLVFLDVEVWPQNHALCWKLHRKPSSQSVALSSESAHPWNCLKSWPVSEIQRMHNRCLRHQHFLDARLAFIRSLKCAPYNPLIVKDVEATIPRVDNRRPRSAVEQRSKVFWVVGFHPILEAAKLGPLANGILSKFGFDKVQVVTAWKNIFPNLAKRLKATI